MRKDLLCRLWRHDTEYYVYGQKIGRWGQLIDKYGPRCKRCHCTGDATYERGLLEFVPRTYFWLRHSARHLLRRWIHTPATIAASRKSSLAARSASIPIAFRSRPGGRRRTGMFGGVIKG